MNTQADVQRIEVLADMVYVEYTDYDSGYISFTKAKTLLRNSLKNLICYTVVDDQKAIDFINSVPKRTSVYENGKSYLKVRA